LALLDMTMQELDGIQLLDIIKEVNPDTECIMVTAVNEAPVAVACLRQGAYDYLVKPVAKEDLALSLHRALEHKRLLDVLHIEKGSAVPELKQKKAFQAIKTVSHRMRRVLKEAELHAGSDVPILITGDSGTGKELLARAIHNASPRAPYPLTTLNMASLNRSIFDAEFFGHTRGAFTGAESNRVGYLEHTHRGTLFLDEIGTLPMEVQGKLLRFLQDGRYLKLGSSVDRFADVRFIAATNADLEQMMLKGLFRKDLYYRIRGGWLHMPPLCERKEDIPLLVKTFLKELSPPSSKALITDEALEILSRHDYPGNVRELKSIVASAVNLAQGQPISPAVLPENFRQPATERHSLPLLKTAGLDSLAAVEKRHILQVYRTMGGNKSQTARVLGIGLNTLRRRLAAYGEK
jgi:DNA-binding NtrC family response regulator